MSENLSPSRNRAFFIAGLGVALLIAVFLSPLASQNPDGLDRVSQDLKFDHKAAENTPARKLPFAQIFDEYALKGVPESVATPLAGLVGTLATFGLAWGIGKLVVRGSGSSSTDTQTSPDAPPSDEPLD
ncbi:MAG TPA: PDGLE domain-containing protein [Stenomitos sp.]